MTSTTAKRLESRFLFEPSDAANTLTVCSLGSVSP